MIASRSGNVEVARLLQSASEDVADAFCGDNTDAHMIKKHPPKIRRWLWWGVKVWSLIRHGGVRGEGRGVEIVD